ncbi:DUF2087 domain-containing protein [Zhihengliuella salsuginis]|uniref:DUF2087 domain-containing protein n=1 Tax=Zhihengliuella salsuginis TaxID=578222 RepID=A0ABQ3GCK2_9MICC|nr:DUF2087 domain-containing protein [Zhihengliuella salsuginis]GHC99411.1 hypothetical protein GCM10008096_01520 [Zhihengliuella salsuginis]
MSAPDWRRLVAVLASQDQREVLAHLLLGQDPEPALAALKPKVRTKTRAALLASEVVDADDDGRLALRAGAFKAMLAASAPARPEGIERFRDGRRIVQFPANATERFELLERVAEEAMRPGEELSERDINERLAAFHEDTALVRRYLVDHGLIRRSPDGAVYVRDGRN